MPNLQELGGATAHNLDKIRINFSTVPQALDGSMSATQSSKLAVSIVPQNGSLSLLLYELSTSSHTSGMNPLMSQAASMVNL